MELNPQYVSDNASLSSLVHATNGVDDGIQSDTPQPPNKVPHIILDSSGDVTLKLGDTLLLVSSKVLSVASPVFRAMFGPHFQEGDALSKSNSTTPAVIALPDDDAHTMTVLCQFLHYQNESLHELFVQESISGLRKLAIVCDKYNCVNAVSFSTNAWISTLEPLEANASEDELFSLVESAYFLDHAVLFERVTKRILMNDVGAILQRMIGWTNDNVLPIKVYGDLEKRRRNLHTELSNGLHEPIGHLIAKAAYEPTTTIENKQYGSINHSWHNFNMHDALQVSSYIRQLHRAGLWPLDPQRHKLATVIESFNKFEDRDISQTMGFSIFPKSPQCQACVLDTRSKLANLMSRILKGCKGLCLDCIDRDKLGNDEVECRIKHD